MPANRATAPCPPLTAALARQIVTHAERYQHWPQPMRAALRARARVQLITTHEGGAA